MVNDYLPNCDVFWVGSYPYKDSLKACRRIFKYPNILPHWPQLPRRSTKERILEQTFTALTKTDGGFRKGTASGWNSIWRMLKIKKINGPYFKTQLAGPVTLFGKLHNSKEQKVSKKELLEYISNWLKHAFWQIDQIKEHGFQPILVLDEPLLPAYMGPSGSAQAKRTLRLLKSIIYRLKKREAIIGIHCCNRISPTALIDLNVDLIHFDVHHFPSQTIQSRQKLVTFLKDGGLIAWGIIPTTDALSPASMAKIEQNFSELLVALAGELPLQRILAQSMVAPTCGTGFLKPEQSEKIMSFATLLSKHFKSRYRLS